MQIMRAGLQASHPAPASYFTGNVHVNPLFPQEASRVTVSSIMFDAGARSAWHTHPLGQTLIITVGVGWVQQGGGQIEEVQVGDVIWFPPQVKHWHGATPDNAMTHIAITELLMGKNVDWMEKVSDEQYRKQT